MAFIRSVLLVGAALISVPASAQTYVSVGGGVSFPNANRFDLGNIDPRVESDTGYAVSALAGYRVDRVRFELEGSYMSADQRNIQSATTSRRDAQGYYHTASVMANVLYEVPLAARLSVYGGAGAGYSQTGYRAGDTAVDAITPRTNIRTVNSGRSLREKGFSGYGSFGYQFIGGADYALTDRIKVGTRYKLVSSYGTRTSVFDYHGTTTTYEYGERHRYRTNNVLGMLTYQF